MKTIIAGGCAPDKIYRLADPDEPYEQDLEASAVRALSCLYPEYKCFIFEGSFFHEGRVSQADLALVANDYSHWFVIEVELISHSLANHVLPQITAFRYGEPLADCTTILCRELGIDHGRAQTLLRHVPRTIAVVANRRDQTWETSLAAHQVQFAVISTFRTSDGGEATEFDGSFGATEESLGFGTYSATDRSFRFHTKIDLPNGEIQISDTRGTPGTWTVIRDENWAWVTKAHGVPAIPHNESVQLRRMYDGSISVRLLDVPSGETLAASNRRTVGR